MVVFPLDNASLHPAHDVSLTCDREKQRKMRVVWLGALF
jgi:hypothetical protein